MRVVWVLAALALAGGCKRKSAKKSGDGGGAAQAPSASPGDGDEGAAKEELDLSAAEAAALEAAAPRMAAGDFVMVGKVERDRAAMPAALSAPITFPGPMLSDRAGQPPRSLVTDAVCSGDAAMRSQLLKAVDAYARKHDDDEDGWDPSDDGYAFWLEYCLRPEFCGFAATEAAARKGGAADYWWALAATCPDPALRPRFERAPPDVVSDWYFNLWLADRRAPYHPALPTSTRDLIADESKDEQDDPVHSGVVYDAQVLTWLADPAGNDALLELHATTKHKVLRNSLAVGMAGSPDPRLRAAHEAACRDAELADACSEARDDIKHPSQRPLPELTECLADDANADCLGELASLDRVAAGKAAKRWKDTEDESFRELATALTRFPQLDAHLAALGLVTPPPSTTDELGADFPENSPRRAIARGGRAAQLDRDGEFFPIDFAHAARVAAALAPELAGIVITQQAPPRKHRDLGVYRLDAWLGGEHYSLRFLGGGTEYLAEPIVGFLNGILIARKSATRAVDLSFDDLLIAVAPLDALRTAVKEGLLVLPTGEAAPGDDDEQDDEEE